MVRLPNFLQDKASSMPESHHGVVTVTVILKNGERVQNVQVAWGKEIVKCKGRTEIPFAEHDIADIEPK